MTLAARSTAVALDPEMIAFMQGGVSMHAASRDAAHVASLSRALGCRVSEDRTRVTVFLLASHSDGMLADFRANGRIAVVFSLPSTHRTIQLKGEDAAPGPLHDRDHTVVARHRAAFRAELASLGYDPSLPDKLMAGSCTDLVAVSFTVSEAFIQTPGPTAGTRLPR